MIYFSSAFCFIIISVDLNSISSVYQSRPMLTVGHFGCVFRGILKVPGQKTELEVAVKTLRSFTGLSFISHE